MILELESPFDTYYRKAYVRVGKDGRKRVDLVNTGKDRTTISYARYLVCVKMGYILSSDFEVDHINKDRTDDRLENLQIMSKFDHREKSRKEMTTGRNTRVLSCVICGSEFEREVRQIRYRNNLCSRSCNGKMSNNLKVKALNPSDVEYIRKNFIKNDREFGIAGLARKFGVSKGTVSKAIYDMSY